MKQTSTLEISLFIFWKLWFKFVRILYFEIQSVSFLISKIFFILLLYYVHLHQKRNNETGTRVTMVATKSFKSEYLGNIFVFFRWKFQYTLEMTWALRSRYRFFSYLLTAEDRTIFTDKIVITIKKALRTICNHILW